MYMYIICIYFFAGESVENRLYQAAEFHLNTATEQTTYPDVELSNQQLLNEGSLNQLIYRMIVVNK